MPGPNPPRAWLRPPAGTEGRRGKPGSVLERPGYQERKSNCLRTHPADVIEGGTAAEVRFQVPSACSIVPFCSPIKHKFSDTIIKNVEMVTTEH